MNLKQECENCGSKHSLVTVYTIEYNVNEKKKESYSTHSNKTVFRLCKKCGNHSDFRLNEIKEKTGFYLACFIPDEFEKALKNLKGTKTPSCVICSQNKDPPNRPNEITKAAIIRLYLDSSKPFGYFCRVCERAYYLPIKRIKWQNHNSFKHSRINVLERLNYWYSKDLAKTNDKLKPLREKLSKGEKMPKLPLKLKPHSRFNEDTGLIQWFMNLDSIGPFSTVGEGAPIGDPNIEYHTVGFPKRKAKKMISSLVNRGCILG